MRVICLVPSLTETLIECGVNVVGRTRFCIHPKDEIENIVKVGGTKGVSWQRCAQLNPDIVVFDREENIKSMAEECPYEWAATHITSVNNVGDELIKLAQILHSDALNKLGQDWNSLATLPDRQFTTWNDVPGALTYLDNLQTDYKRLEYIIWREPWMAVGADTFITSMLQKLGFGTYLAEHPSAYPELSDQDMSRDDTFYLFSSEPYPFGKHQKQLIEENFNGAIVDGEVYSWFGIRSYKSLASYLHE